MNRTLARMTSPFPVREYAARRDFLLFPAHVEATYSGKLTGVGRDSLTADCHGGLDGAAADMVDDQQHRRPQVVHPILHRAHRRGDLIPSIVERDRDAVFRTSKKTGSLAMRLWGWPDLMVDSTWVHPMILAWWVSISLGATKASKRATSYIENPLPAPIRQAIAMHARKVRYKGGIAIGGSLVYRTVLNLMSRAMSLISGKPSPIPRFVTDEAAARATIAQLRQGEASDKGHGA
jgi:hypothetical protein